MREALLRSGGIFAAGCVVYVVMSACSASGNGAGGDDDGSPWGGLSGTSGATSSGSPVPNAMADTWYASGSRLKLRYYEASDGAKQFLGWFDSMRNEDCAIRAHADGSLRCMPSGAFVGTLYSDSACSSPVVNLVKGSPAPKYLTRGESQGSRIFTTGPLFGGTVYYATPGSCPVYPSSASYDIYGLGAEIPSSAFVGATEKKAP